MSKLFGRFYCEVSGMMCRVRLRNPPVPSPCTVKETLRFRECGCVCVCVCVCVCDRETDERKTELNFRNHAIKSFSSSFIYSFWMPVQFLSLNQVIL